MATLTKLVLNMSPAQWRVCEPKERWGARALYFSSFITLRVGVFVIALVLMGYLLLPKSEKEGSDSKSTQIIETITETGLMTSSLTKSRHSRGASGNFSSMEVIDEEDF
eukprot:CAMPEP_0183732652 /NCGR_PEP_ID=MMETSP0737-20130205/39019_1 /TAXON_ID=385413 /ORGANISM="Thalassiosira miniscula, Strain CCMP1093" /LENGTH=108 /DNA_ID=CAMNT_0025965723 /DNA_START=127 /DNA_END=453 /DNA_ORIENTATION=-